MLRRYGAHLSPMLVEMVEGLTPDDLNLPRVKESFDHLFNEFDESPYHDSPYRD